MLKSYQTSLYFIFTVATLRSLQSVQPEMEAEFDPAIVLDDDSNGKASYQSPSLFIDVMCTQSMH